MKAEIIRIGIFQCNCCVPNIWEEEQIFDWFNGAIVEQGYANPQPRIITDEDMKEAKHLTPEQRKSKVPCDKNPKTKSHIIIEY